MSSLKFLPLAAACVVGAASLCPPCGNTREAAAQEMQVPAQHSDTAIVRLHISKMTCATCPVTARVALKKLGGVYDATVTYADSLGVVRYDPRRVTPAQIAAHLTRLTGYPARILPDSSGSQSTPRL